MTALENTPEENLDNLPFEDALSRLESIIEHMQHDKVPLDDLVVYYEKGSQLLKICQKRLKDAELRVLALKKEDKEPSPFDEDLRSSGA